MPEIDIFAQAFAQLKEARIVEISDALVGTPDGGRQFVCHVSISAPNSGGLPESVGIRVDLPATFPYCPVEITPLDEAISGFPHQDAKTRKLCLPDERDAPRGVARLEVYVRWAKEWLQDAANESLLKPGDPYELPHFANPDKPTYVPSGRSLWFLENGDSFGNWKRRIPSVGTVTLRRAEAPRMFLASEFSDGHSIIQQAPFSDQYLHKAEVINTSWVLLPTVIFTRHRPPATFGEFRAVLNRHNMCLDAVLFDAWRGKSTERCSVILVGFPIPSIVGEGNVEIHWQGLLSAHVNAEPGNFSQKNGIKKIERRWRQIVKDGRFADDKRLEWLATKNVSRERLYARGGIAKELQALPFSIVGVGAIGAAVSELFTRCGTADVTLFDGDVYLLENQCRHTLDGNFVGRGKASSLAYRLGSSNPTSNIRGFDIYVPFPPNANASASTALDRAGVIIDCSANDGCFEWLSCFASRGKRRLVHMYVNLGASLLTMIISGRNTTGKKVMRSLYADIGNGLTPIDPVEYFRQDHSQSLVFPGAGCWHPTFPARIDQIWMLVSAAFELLCRELQKPQCSGSAFILGRQDDFDSPRALTELLWSATYR